MVTFFGSSFLAGSCTHKKFKSYWHNSEVKAEGMGWTMRRIHPEIKKRIVEAVRRGIWPTEVAKVFDVSRKTVWKSSKQWRRPGRPTYRDKPRKPKHPRKNVTGEAV